MANKTTENAFMASAQKSKREMADIQKGGSDKRETDEVELKKISLLIPAWLHKQAQLHRVETGESMTKLIVRLRSTTCCVRCGSTYARTASQTSLIFRTGAMRTTTAGLRHSIVDFRRLSRNTSTGVFIREEVEPVDGFTSEKGIGT